MDLKRRVVPIMGAAILGITALASPSMANAGGYAASYAGSHAHAWGYTDGWSGGVCDDEADGRSALGEYWLNGLYFDSLYETRGNGHCSNTPREAHQIDHLHACYAGFGGIGWNCASWVYTGY